jgi:hypothetical protein
VSWTRRRCSSPITAASAVESAACSKPPTATSGRAAETDDAAPGGGAIARGGLHVRRTVQEQQRHSIYRMPAYIKDLNRMAYRPRVVSLQHMTAAHPHLIPTPRVPNPHLAWQRVAVGSHVLFVPVELVASDDIRRVDRSHEHQLGA